MMLQICNTSAQTNLVHIVPPDTWMMFSKFLKYVYKINMWTYFLSKWICKLSINENWLISLLFLANFCKSESVCSVQMFEEKVHKMKIKFYVHWFFLFVSGQTRIENINELCKDFNYWYLRVMYMY
jgi:hypothetical protein